MEVTSTLSLYKSVVVCAPGLCAVPRVAACSLL